MVTYIRSDLEFILAQIKIAEQHAAGIPLAEILPNVQVPYGLRTVSGEFNNLVAGQDQFGAADNLFPRLLPAEFRPGYDTSGPVIDADPRIISNLIVDQTNDNPAAAAAAAESGGGLVTSPGLDGIFGTADDVPVNFIPNSTPDAGLSAGFNAWFTFFGQFFDHGLDLVTKGGNDIIAIPLQPGDPLYVEGSPTNFMLLTRATQFAGPGADGLLGTPDDTVEHQNTTSPFVDQNQTYTSHPSHQVFLRAYETGTDGAPHNTGKLITNRDVGDDGQFGTGDDTEIGGMATWGVVKAQAHDILGINLTDADAFDVPLLLTDDYGNFIPGLNGFPQVVMFDAATNTTFLVEGDPTANGGAGIDLTDAVRTGHQFLIDVAHSAVPVFDAAGNLVADADDVAGNAVAFDPTTGQNLEYDNELLDAHYIAGDGRVNENIGLTAVHSIFHSEHNRLVDHTKDVLIQEAITTGDVTFLNEWLTTDITTLPADLSTLDWDGERLFQAAKFGTEMQYQHLVFEEFARTVQPQVDIFLAPNGYDTSIDPSIVAEFAHTVYRFGHSMLVETVDRLDADFGVVGPDPAHPDQQLGLIAAFLNPLAFVDSGATPEDATSALVRGLTRQAGNEIDEFVTEAVRNNLLGLPLDLAAINIARGRDTGIPSLNHARAQFYEMTGDSQLKAYTSWVDFMEHLKHPESLINFIAAYGTHAALTAADVDTLDEMRAVAAALVFGGSAVINAGADDERTFAADDTDRLDFLNARGVYAGGDLGGLNLVDFWIGGLAEQQMPFGGLLGSSFNFVFETQLEALQNGDRFYYLSRTAGMHFGTELEQNSFSKLVQGNTDVTHLPNAIFSTPTWILEVDVTKQHTGLGGDGRADPTGGIMIGDVEVTPLVIRDNPNTDGPDTNYLQYTGDDHVVLGGTAGNDIIVSGDGDDTVYGDGGNDRLEGGQGNDVLLGGDGDDILTDVGGDNNLQGGDGNDVIVAARTNAPQGEHLILAGRGNDFIVTPEDISTIFGGEGNDFIYGAKTNLQEMGGEGDDWIELGTQDGAPGDNFDPFEQDQVLGNDVFIGGPGFDEFIGEGGDDIMVGSDAQDKMAGMNGFDWVTYQNDKYGVTADMSQAIFLGLGEVGDHIVQPVGQSPAAIFDRFFEVEGISGSAHSDELKGDNFDLNAIAEHGGAENTTLRNIALIDGLQEVLGEGVSSFVGGNIMLGGAGSDVIEGRGGDDLIDGDKALVVRISVRDANGIEINSFDSMQGKSTLASDTSGKTLTQYMLDGTYNPGQLQIVREIIDDPDQGFDTAVFSGSIADYQWTVDDNGTVDDLSDDIVTVFDTVVGRDGIDTLKHVERLQFSDASWTLDAGLGRNFDPLGQLTVIDNNGGTLQVGDLLSVSSLGITDDDNISPENPTGSVAANRITYVWQVERVPGSGVFEDIILGPLGDLAFQSANGQSLRIPADVAGLSIRVKGVYQDDHGVVEQVFSVPTAPVDAFTPPAPTTPVAQGPIPTESGPGVQLVRSDLNFILDQIKIAEAHAAGADLLSLLPNIRSAFGLRSVTGDDNNLLNINGNDQSHFGAADTLFPRLLDPEFRNDNDGDSITLGPPGPGTPVVTNTDYGAPGAVVDADPRTISNLIVDQTNNNPAAAAAAAQNEGSETVVSPGLDGIFGTTDDVSVNFIPNIAPDAGLTAPFNAWFTFFGQFFDHGLDLVTKGGNDTIYIPLEEDDPLFVPGGPANFMVLTRATVFQGPGADGVIGTADDTTEHQNTTSPFVDQNQTYSSHPSHQVFLRAYEIGADGEPHATGKLITNRDLGPDGEFGTGDDVELGGMATWAVVKAQARDLLGIDLTDDNVFNVPLLATDEYGNYVRGPNGFPQVVFPGNVLVEGNPAAPISLAGAVLTGHQFLIDVAHNASPISDRGVQLTADTDTEINVGPQPTGTYDNELLDAHYMAGDGRVNENIGLTAVHAIFHSEHNRLADQTKGTVVLSGDLDFINEWLLTPLASLPTIPLGLNVGDPDALNAFVDGLGLNWNGERLFQVAKFGTEMQYQHLVFEEFARTIQPNVDLFFAPTQVYDVDLDPAIVAEFAHTVYRFGHSMLTETVDRFDGDFNTVDGDPQLGLIAAFLNPLAFAESGPTAEEATSAIIRGVTRQVGNEIDEFVTEALRNNLLGLPLDLPAINIARGRDTGIPTLNHARAQIYAATGDAVMKPYTSWADFVQHIKHPESLINFIAAYGTHDTIRDVDTLAEKRAAATLLVLGGAGAPADRLDFLNATGSWAGFETGLNDIDFWIGGLAEEISPFGGMLGSTFNFVFENQLEKLQDGDRFYYLERTAGLNFNAELEGNSFSRLIMANTNVQHLPGVVFLTPAFTLEVDQSKQFNASVIAGPDGILLDDPNTPEDETADNLPGNADPTAEGPFAALHPFVIRDNPETPGADTNYLKYTGPEHVVLGGTAGNDIIISSEGDDTLYGDDGDDRLEGGDGNDFLNGGDGNDIITDTGGDDNIKGGDGDDVIQGGNGVNLILGGFGNDFIVTGEDASEAFGGQGNDFILGSKANEQDMGNEGDDWLEAGTSDGSPGDNFDPFGNDPIIGNDVYIGRGELDKFNGEGGDDIMVGKTGLGDRYIGGSGYDWAVFKDDQLGVYIDLTNRFFDQPPVPGSGASALTRFDIVEGLSGSSHADVLMGDNEDPTTLPGAGPQGSVLTNIGLIDGLQTLLDTALGTPVTFFDGGNIILGGAGGDLLEGRGGNDILDGDAWLNVRISVRENVNDPSTEIATFDSMVDMVPFMVNGTYSASQLVIVREILQANSPDFDTAIFTGNRADYTITIDDRGTTDTLDDVVTVTDTVGTDGTDRLMHIERLRFADQTVLLTGTNNAPVGTLAITGDPTQGQPLTVSIAGVTDADNPGGIIPEPVSYFWQADLRGDGIFTDIEVVRAAEIARVEGRTFTPTEDEVGLSLRVRAIYRDANGVLEEVFSTPTTPIADVNDAPIGLPTISDTTPAEGELLTALVSGIVDPDGTTTSFFSFQWQQSDVGGGGTFVDIPEGTIATFTPGADQVGRQLRVVVTFVDDNGNTETVTSAPTAVTSNVNDAPIGFPTISDTTPTLGQLLTASTAGIADLDGLTTAVFAFQWQQSDLGGGGAFTNIAGATASTFTPTAAQVNRALRVVVSYTDDNGTSESVTSAATTVTGTVFAGGAGTQNFAGTEGDDIASGGAGNDLLNGLGGSDILSGDAGTDVINGGAGNDLITGGVGNDALFGEAGNDTFNYTIGDGADAIDGGTGIDWLRIVGTAANNTLAATFDGSVLTSVAGSSLAGIELVTADLLGGVDTLNYTGTTAAVTVNLGTGTASGFGTIAGIENVTGGTGADHLTGSADANTLSGGAGDDTLAGGLGNDVLTGGAGIDTASYAGETDNMFVSLATNNARRGSAAAAVEDTLSSIENILGGLGNDTLTGSAAANTLDGGAGNDTLSGGAGADALVGGTGNDLIIGGTGNDALSGGADDDIFSYTIGDGIDTIDGGIGNDTLSILGTAAANTLDVIFNGASITQFEGGTIASVEAVTADLLGGADRLSYAGTTAAVTVDLAAGTASGFASILNIENATGGSGNDTFIGDGAVNNFAGGLGDDTYFVGAGDTITEAAGAGIDQVFTTATTFTLSANVENLTYTGAGNFTGNGSAVNNVITGGTGVDLLSGNGGADTLIGGGGADLLQGGAGDDILVGGAGNDTLNGGAGNDMFVFGPGFGDDVITGGFDANAASGQDLLDIAALSITAANFGDHVSITDLGSNTMVTIDGSTILLMGVNGVGTNVITIDDFHLLA